MKCTSKERFGDFELDTIVGANHQRAIVSIVDRATKCVFLRLMPNYTAELVKEALCSTLSPLGKKGLVKTLTSDNGKEFAPHEKVVEVVGETFILPHLITLGKEDEMNTLMALSDNTSQRKQILLQLLMSRSLKSSEDLIIDFVKF